MNETKPGKGDAGGVLSLRRAAKVREEEVVDVRARLVLALAETVDSDYAERGYPVFWQEKAGRSASSDSRPPLLRLPGGASVTVKEAVAVVASGPAPVAPVAVVPPSVPGVPPAGRPMMNQNAEKAGGAAPAAGTSGSPPAGAPLTVKRKLEVRTAPAPVAPPPGVAPALAGPQTMATRAPLLPLPIDAALGGKPPALLIPSVMVTDKKTEAKVAERRKKNSPIGLGAILVTVFVVLFLGGVFWMQRGGGEEVASPKGVVVAGREKVSSVEVVGAAAGDAPEVVSAPPAVAKPVQPVAIAQLTTVSGTVAWELAGPAWASPNGAAETKPSEAVAPVANAGVAADHAKPVVKAAPPAPLAAKAAVAATGGNTPARRPAPTPAFQVFVESLKVSGVLNQTPVRAIIDGGTVFAGDLLEPTLGIRLVGADFAQRQLIFEDKTRAQMKVYY